MSTVPVHVGSLAIGEEFVFPLTRRRAVLVTWGWVRWDDGHGRHVKVRAVRVRFAGGEERNVPADRPVLVPADRPHVTDADLGGAARWEEELRETESIGRLGEVARRTRV